jgi:primosomal protein N' (replication factor Y)
MLFAEIILPLPLAQTYTYFVPQEFESQIVVGQRVIVSFGVKKFYTGIVAKLKESTRYNNLKPITQILDNEPIVFKNQLKFWEQISEYYCVSLGEVYKAAVPALLRDEMKQRFKEKTVNIFTPNFDVNNSDAINSIVNSLNKSKKQQAIFVKILDLIFNESRSEFESRELQKLTNSTAKILNSLVKKDILKIKTQIISRLSAKKIDRQAHFLTVEQQNCLKKIEKEFEQKSTVLLHGVTSSGKTEIYIHLIIKALKQNLQTLFLVPEIGLTSQLVERLQGIFGEKLLTYHSKIFDSQKVEIWNLLLQNTDSKVIIGTRSSIFLPFRNLGLIVIDEEHDSSFKQNDASPRYNARSSAGFLAQIFDAKILLGSATPSVENYSKAQFGKFGFAELLTRFLDIQMPDIQIIDINAMYYRKRMQGHFSLELINGIEQTLAQKKQVILFQNRRGFSLAQECPACGFVRKCPCCDVSLTWHKSANALSCHYCGYTIDNHQVCANCGGKNLENRGFGTEQVQQEAVQLFPNAKIGRLDFETTRKKDAFDKIIFAFEQKKLDILVGTLMVSKGIDFSNVGLVGVMNADNLMNFPDFRAHENAFQTLVQVSGRAGRKNGRGKVLIQTFSPQSILLKCVKNNDYQSFFRSQMLERQMFNYPPYCRLIQLTLKHKNEDMVQKAAENFVEILSQNDFFSILGPDKPPVAKVRYLHLRKILLKTSNAVLYKTTNNALFEIIELFRRNPDYKYITIFIDVDTV